MSLAPHSRLFVNFPEALPGQFIFFDRSQVRASDLEPLRDGWSRVQIGNFEIHRAPELPIVRCRGDDGEVVGFFLGYPIDFDAATAVSTELVLPSALISSGGLGHWVEQHIYRFAGRFVFVLTWQGHSRVYLDAAGSLPVVYDADARLVGSTAGAIYGPQEFIERFDDGIFDRLNLLDGGWFPGRLTAHRGLQRLTCNFYLDLESWQPQRHWPSDMKHNPDPDAASLMLGEEIRKGVRAYLALGSCCMALTGGHETRLLLSTVRNSVQSMTFFCLSETEPGRDQVISSRLARRFGLRLRFIQFPEVTDQEAIDWMARTGFCAAEHRYRYKGVKQLNEFNYCIGGSAGEVGRGFFWRPGDGARPLTAPEIYSRLGLPSCLAAEKAVADWTATLPTKDPLLQLDLAYLELRMSCWFAVQTYGSIGPKQAYPMISRRVFRRMLEVPPSHRRANEWILCVIRSFWPELLTVPINSLGPFREAVRTIVRAVRRPSLVARRLRRRFG